MRRSSVIVLILAVLLLVVMAFLYFRSLDTTAPPMTPQVAEAILERGRAALERHDTEGILALTTPDARLLNRSPDQLRTVLNQAMAELGRENLSVTWSHLNVKQEGQTAFVSFNLNVGQKNAAMDALYWSARVRLELRKVRIPHWFGFYSTEEWKIQQADSDNSLEVPLP